MLEHAFLLPIHYEELVTIRYFQQGENDRSENPEPGHQDTTTRKRPSRPQARRRSAMREE